MKRRDADGKSGGPRLTVRPILPHLIGNVELRAKIPCVDLLPGAELRI